MLTTCLHTLRECSGHMTYAVMSDSLGTGIGIGSAPHSYFVVSASWHKYTYHCPYHLLHILLAINHSAHNMISHIYRMFLGQLPLGQLPLGQLPWGQLPQGQLPCRTITPVGQLPRGQLPPRTTTPMDIYHQDNYPYRTTTPIGRTITPRTTTPI